MSAPIKVHFRNQFGGPSCGSRMMNPLVTAEPGEVTCVGCGERASKKLTPDQLGRIRRMGGHAAARNQRTHPSVAKQYL